MQMLTEMNEDGTMAVKAVYTAVGVVNVENSASEEIVKAGFERAMNLAFAIAFRDADAHTKVENVEVALNARKTEKTHGETIKLKNGRTAKVIAPPAISVADPVNLASPSESSLNEATSSVLG